MPYFHLTARAKYPHRPFVDRDQCADLWGRLRGRFKHVLACVLMPNHLHLVVESGDVAHARTQWITELSALSKSRYAGRGVWEPTPAPESLATRLHLLRQIRYVHLNPCRARLASDPLEWEWSTHRDVVGAASPSWVDLPNLASIMGCTPKSLPREIHAYVSGDPSVRVAGTALPALTDPSQIVVTLSRVEEAVLAAGRGSAGAFRMRDSALRGVAAHLAFALGGRNQKTIADWLGMTPRGLRKRLEIPLGGEGESVLRGARLILSDRERFKPHPPA